MFSGAPFVQSVKAQLESNAMEVPGFDSRTGVRIFRKGKILDSVCHTIATLLLIQASKAFNL